MFNHGLANITNPTFEHCIFEQNTANSAGGAICNDGRGGNASPTFTNCLFKENLTRSSGEGGALYNNANRICRYFKPFNLFVA